MPTNNPQSHTSSPQSGKSGTEQSSSFQGRVERNVDRIEQGAEQLEKRAEQLATSAVDRMRGARDQAENGIVQQRDLIAKRLRRLGGVFRGGSESLSGDDPLAKELLEMTSDQIERVADYIGEITPNRVSDDLQSFARRRPGVFFGGAFLLGLTLGRFVRSSGSPSSSQDELELELDDDESPDADRYQRPYAGRPMASTSRGDDAAPGSGASMTSATSMSGSAASNRPYPSTSTTTTGSMGATPSSTVPSQPTRGVSGPMSSGGTLPPPSFSGAGSSGSSGGSTGGTGMNSNVGGGSPVETTRGHGAKS